MYTVDDRDRVVELHDLPESCAGAPCPMVIAVELNHARSWLRGGNAPEETSYAAGDAFIEGAL